MTLKYYFKTASIGLGTYKSRTALTILGIVIGITAIILILSLGKGAQNLILSQIQSIGPKVIAIMPGRQPKGPTDILSTFTDSLKQRDLDALSNKSNVPHLETIMPVVFGSATAVYGSETFQPTILGVTDYFSQIYGIYPDEGRLFTDDEVKSYADVAIIGSKVKTELFGNDEALNQKIKIKGRNFKVIGILSKKGQVSFLNFDEAAFIPYTTAQQYIFGIKYFNRIVVDVDDAKNVLTTVEDITITLRNSHGITDPSKDDFFIQTSEQAMQIVGSITSVLTLFLVAVAAISLLVGGVGIMNIMLVSVTERTREIGLRKAIGAKNRDILTQFLFESVILTCLGGAIGIFFGIILSIFGAVVIGYFLGQAWPTGISLFAIILGFCVAAFIGIVFGIYPARRASKLNPIEALRYE